jgi:3-hydroxyacyl-CoA dehydrogenase
MNGTRGELREDRIGDVLVLVLDHPPLNRLTPAMRAALIARLTAPGDAAAIVLCGAGTVFSGGPPEGLDEAAPVPDLAALCQVIEASQLPVVVALSGRVTGPGAELALAAHARVSDEGASIGFGDVLVGLLPQAGTTQRLPRLVGAAEALKLLLSGRPVPAHAALAMGLVDQVATDSLVAALAMAGAMKGPRPVSGRRDGMGDPAGWQRAVATARTEADQSPQPAFAAVVQCVEAALLFPFEAGVALEATLRAELLTSPEASALHSARQAERRAAVLPRAVAALRPPQVTRLAFGGTAPGMAPLALLALAQGLEVIWAEPDRPRLAASLEWIAARQQAEVEAGRLPEATREADWARLLPTLDIGALEGAEALVLAPGFAPPRSAGPVLVMGGQEGAFGVTIAPSGRLAELSLPDGAAPAHVAAAVALLRKLGLPPLLVHGMPVVGARLAAAGDAALGWLLREGAAEADLAPMLADFAAGAQKRSAAPLAAEREAAHRWLGAMANEGLRLVGEGVVRRPSDIDHLMVAGHGFARWKGGPMHQAKDRGLMVLRADLRRWQAQDEVWSPATLLDELVSDGVSLEVLSSSRPRSGV